MALPEIIKDIEARVQDTGDIMTGNLYIDTDACPGVFFRAPNGGYSNLFKNSSATVEDGTHIRDTIASGAFVSLLIKASNGITSALQVTDGTSTCTVLHTGNMYNHLDGEYVNIVGDKMTGTLKAPLFIGTDNETDGGIVYGIYYNNENIPQSGIGSIRGTYSVALFNDCNYTNSTMENQIGKRCFYYNDTDSYQHYPSCLQLSAGSLYFLKASNGNIARAQYEEIPMTTHEILHTGNKNLISPNDIGAPTLTGGGASGTWPISISGNAGTATTASAIRIYTQASITTAGAGWYRIASYANTAIPRGQVHFTLWCTGSSVYPYTTEITIDTSWGTSATNYIIIEGHKYLFGGVRVANDGTNTFIEVYTSSALPNTCMLIVPYGTYNYWTNTQWTWAAAGALTASTATTTILEATHNHSGQSRTNNITASAVYGAVWNDYAEYRTTVNNIKAGMVVIEQGDGSLQPSTDRLQPGGNIISDTFGFAIGETDESKTPLAVSGRALAYPAEDRYSYEPGDAVGTGPNGTVSKMTREEIMMYPERIIGTVSEIPEYERWGTGDVLVDGRIWIKVK